MGTQKTITLSYGEAELGGVVKAAAEGIGLQSLAQDLGLDFSLQLYADSSAAIGICRRTGIGRVRHLAVGQLWVVGLCITCDLFAIYWIDKRLFQNAMT